MSGGAGELLQRRGGGDAGFADGGGYGSGGEGRGPPKRARGPEGAPLAMPGAALAMGMEDEPSLDARPGAAPRARPPGCWPAALGCCERWQVEQSLTQAPLQCASGVGRARLQGRCSFQLRGRGGVRSPAPHQSVPSLPPSPLLLLVSVHLPLHPIDVCAQI
jgi:hypothetical protein